MGQAKYVCAVHRFIQELLLKAAPELLKGSGALKSDKEFKDTIDAAIASVTTPDAKERDYIRAIVEAASDEMKPRCHLLRGAAEVVGLGEIATRYLDGARFREMLLRRDEEKLERLNAIVQDQSQAVPVKVLMDVAAELDGRAENYDGMDAAAKRKASREMKKLIGKVEEMRSAIDANTAEIERRINEGKKEIVSHVDEVGGKVEAVGKKVDNIKLRDRRGRRPSYSEEARGECLAYWEAAKNNTEVKHAINTRITFEAVFAYYRRQLEKLGIDTVKKFRIIVHSSQSRESEARKRALEAKIEAERKAKKNNPQTSPLTSSPLTSSPLTSSPLTSSPLTSSPLTSSPLTSSPLTTKKPKCGKIHGMKKRTMRSLLAGALAVFGASAFGAVMPQLPEPTFECKV